MAGRVAMVLVAGLLLLLIIGAVFYLHDRGERTIGLFAKKMAVQVAAMADLMDRTPPGHRKGVLTALGGPLMHVTLSPRPPRLEDGGWKGADDVPWPVRPYLNILEGRTFYVRLLRPWDDEEDDDDDNDDDDDFGGHRRHRMIVAVGLEDGQWLRVNLHPGRRPWRGGPGAVGWLILTVVLVLAAAVWAAHRMTRPLRQLAQAADQFGVDVRAPPMAEDGPRELRRAARAFNRMQARLRRFVDDRTLMLAAISHDLRTVLTRLRLRAEFIDDGEQQGKAIADIDEMQAMLDETLSFARDDANNEKPIRADLSALLQSLCGAVVDMGGEAAFNGPEHVTIQGRPVALRRAFGNLIDNAIRYGGRAAVRLSLAQEEAVVEILDSGPGIAEEMRERVFRPFFRLESSRSRETGGTGLGLASARTVIHRHGGDISLHDGPEGGLLVRVSLPLDHA